MKKHKRTGRHGFTAFIYLDSHKCRACWKCIETCPRGVIGKIDMLFHKHARVADPTRCKGCLKCVKACPQQAISALRKGDNRLHEVVNEKLFCGPDGTFCRDGDTYRHR